MQKNYEVLLGNSMLLLFFFSFFFFKYIGGNVCYNAVALSKFDKYGIFTVSQFTLYGILKGNKPDFHVAMPPQTAKPFYASLIERFQKSYKPDAIKGRFFFCFLFIYLF